MTDIAASPSTAQRNSGARYTWFWTSGTKHHTEQMKAYKTSARSARYRFQTQYHTKQYTAQTVCYKVDNASPTSAGTEQVKWKSCLMKFFANFTPASLPHCPLAWSWTNCLLFKTALTPPSPPSAQNFQAKECWADRGNKICLIGHHLLFTLTSDHYYTDSYK